jgi:hypothetical protein
MSCGNPVTPHRGELTKPQSFGYGICKAILLPERQG